MTRKTLAGMNATQNTMQPYSEECWYTLHVNLEASGWKKPDTNGHMVSDPT